MVDKARAAKDGNEFHELWAARRALELLNPRDHLRGLGIEGFSLEDAEHSSAAGNEIADLILYYGNGCRFDLASRVEVCQFKYSIAAEHKAFVASDAKKTLAKFVASEDDHRRKHGAGPTEDKLRFSIVTNRPIDHHFEAALVALAAGQRSDDPKVISQAQQIVDACGLSQKRLESFLSRLELRGRTGVIAALRGDVATRIVSWSASTDHLAGSRIGALRALLRAKAGTEGDEGHHIIRLADVLGALGVASEADLLPAPASFVEIGSVVPRSAAEDAVLTSLSGSHTVIVHAAGGVGKTVFMQSLASRLHRLGEVILFDCFGGGNYRSVADARHLPERGLLHILNALATAGLCDPTLPGPIAPGDLLRTAIRRLQQAVVSLRAQEPTARLFILLDAADNAAMQAADRHEPAFPTLLAETFAHEGAPDGVALVLSCRTERIGMTNGSSRATQLPLQPFTPAETEAFLKERVSNPLPHECDVAQVRSGGNARVLSHLVEEWSELVRDPQAGKAPIEVESLVERRLDQALSRISKHGLDKQARSFLCGLTVLPPPIPVKEYANAMGIAQEGVESFAADLSPLLDRTNLGITFRDEPTETYVRNRYGSDPDLLVSLSDRLMSTQSTSTYAAGALPRLLWMLDDSGRALELAMSDVLPAAVHSDLGKRAIRTQRLTTALALMSKSGRISDTIRLLVELAQVAAKGDRLDTLIASYPDMVAITEDVEAVRRLFELKTAWPGARHARLAVAHLIMGNVPDAGADALRAEQWLIWYLDQDQAHRSMRLEPIEVAARPLQLIARGDFASAFRVLDFWKPWFAFLVTRETARMALHHLGIAHDEFAQALHTRAKLGPAVLAAVVDAGLIVNRATRVQLLKKLSLACAAPRHDNKTMGEEYRPFHEALTRCAGLAIRHDLLQESRQILLRAAVNRPGHYAFAQDYRISELERWLIHSSLLCITEGRLPQLVDILPEQARECLPPVVDRDYSTQEITDLLDARHTALAQQALKDGKPVDKLWRDVSESVARYVAPLLPICTVFADEILNGARRRDSPLLDSWAEVTKRESPGHHATAQLRRKLVRDMAIFALRLGGRFQKEHAERLVSLITDTPGHPLSVGIALLAQLAVEPKTASLAPALLPWLEKSLDAEGDASQKADVLAQIARALWPVSPADSRHYVQRSMQQLDSLSSADFELVHELLPLLEKLHGHHLSPEHFQRLTNLCEMSFNGEPSKFPWVSFAGAAAQAQGLRSLAQIGRWASREEVDCGYSAPPLIVELVRAGLLSTDTASALLLLDEVGESYSFSIGSVVATLTAADPARAEELARRVVDQYELDRPSSSSSYSLERIAESLPPQLPADSSIRRYLSDRIAFLLTLPSMVSITSVAQQAKRRGQPRLAGDSADAARHRDMLRRCNPLDQAAIEAALETIKAASPGMYDKPRMFIRELAGRVTPAGRIQFIDLVSNVSGISLEPRLQLLADLFDEWEAQSPSLATHRQVVFDRVVLAYGPSLIGKGWGFMACFEQLTRIGRLPQAQSALAVSGGVTKLPLATNARTWLRLATLVAGDGHGQAVHEAVSRLLDGPAMEMATSFGEGPFQASFDPGESEAEIAAGFIWIRLGSIDAFERWRAAHAVRLLATSGGWEILDRLVDLYEKGQPGAFMSPQVKFNLWDARVWLVLALARSALEDPQVAKRYQEALTREAFSPTEPHLLLQEIARTTLQRSASLTQGSPELVRLLSTHDPLAKTRVVYERTSSDPYRPRGHGIEPEQPFYLEYDFQKYQPANLGEAFGLPAWQVADDIRQQAHRWDPDAKSMNDGASRWSHRNHRSPEGRFRSYGSHLGWNAMFSVAGRYLATRAPAARDRWGSDPLADFLRRHGLSRSDGLWLSDGTDRHPPITHAHLRAADGKHLEAKAWRLRMLAGIIDRRPAEAVVASARWESGDGVQVKVRTAMVPRRAAIAACRKLSQGPEHDIWLPELRYEGDDVEAQTAFEPWIVSPQIESRFDEFDTFGSPSASTRPMPASAFRTWAAIRPADPFNRSWVDQSGIEAMHAYAWGERRGYGEDEHRVVGEALICRTSVLSDYLAAKDLQLAMLVQIDRYSDRHSSDANVYRSNSVLCLLSSQGKLAWSSPTVVSERMGW